MWASATLDLGTSALGLSVHCSRHWCLSLQVARGGLPSRPSPQGPAPRQSLPHRGPTSRCCGCLAWCGHQGRVLRGAGRCGACPSGPPTLLHLLCAKEPTCTGLIWGSGRGQEERDDVSPSCFLQRGLSLHCPKRDSGSQFWKLSLQPLRAEGDETSQPRQQGLVSPPVPTSILLTCHQGYRSWHRLALPPVPWASFGPACPAPGTWVEAEMAE